MIKKLLIFSSLILTVNIGFAQQTDVAEAVNRLTKLMISPDSLALNKLVLNDLSYGHSSGKVETKQEFMHALLSGASDFVDINLTDQKIIVQNKTALVRHTLNAKTNDKNIPGTVKLHVLLIWSKEKAGWKLLGRQAVKVL
ncbi:MAG: nuclear transport factor 2 family protein [Pedobacter agri]|uniref:Nuclear transport factor 2 family protein n=1 Tax=Pedobacter agri TaxID=454586 RepID=A0A9X3DE84_9SPHI|nr:MULTISPECIES: nuclear transport factor 2 family protein [Pedobacter]AZI27312.1 nuclear transport factor 2 family protein [Pedobacter sp. G11]MCX3265565.1 nuclear transport factor 2 family protein [Pedobacter agri]